MPKNNKNQNLSWDDFIKLGNPENAPDEPSEKSEEITDLSHHVVRIFLEKKHRGGKTASVIRGIDEDDDYLKALAKKLNSFTS